MGSFFNIFNSEHKRCFKIAENNKFFFHSSISYPGASYFYKKISKKKKENDQRLILKIAGYSFDQLKFEIQESLKEFNLENLYGFQIWEKLPTKDNKVDKHELEKIIKYLEDLKKQNIIKKTFFQLEPYKFNFDDINYFDGYAFYGYPYELEIEKDQFFKIIQLKKIILQFQFFGGRNTKLFRENFEINNSSKLSQSEKDKMWISECLKMSHSISYKNCMFVGCTQKSKRLNFLVDLMKQNKNNFKKIDNINFAGNLKYEHKFDYPIEHHRNFLKKIRSNWFLIKLYIKKLITRIA